MAKMLAVAMQQVGEIGVGWKARCIGHTQNFVVFLFLTDCICIAWLYRMRVTLLWLPGRRRSLFLLKRNRDGMAVTYSKHLEKYTERYESGNVVKTICVCVVFEGLVHINFTDFSSFSSFEIRYEAVIITDRTVWRGLLSHP